MKEYKPNDPYISRDGFVKVPLRRGFDLIRPLWDIMERANVTSTNGKCFICGGYARWCASPRRNPVEAKDVDIYCSTEYVFNVLKSTFEKLSFEIRHENEMAITYKLNERVDYKTLPTVQLIKPVNEGAIVAMADMQVVLENFDFTIIRTAIIDSENVLADADFIHDEEKRIIRIKNIHCPISSTLRCMKYSRKGYFLAPYECLKLFLDWESRDELYRDKLITLLQKTRKENGLTREEVEEMEALMRID